MYPIAQVAAAIAASVLRSPVLQAGPPLVAAVAGLVLGPGDG